MILHIMHYMVCCSAAEQRCTDRWDELPVPLQHHVNVLHQTQQAEEATAAEERGEVRLQLITRVQLSKIYCVFYNLLLIKLMYRCTEEVF